MRLPDERIVDLLAREWQGRKAKAGQGRSRWGGRSVCAEREHGERCLAGLIDVEEARDVVVDESGDDVGRDAERGRDGKEVCEQGARVPEAMPVRARAVLPGVPPKRARQHDQDGSVGRVRLVSGRGDEKRAVVAGPERPQREVVRAEVMDARRETRDVAAHDVRIDVVERARACGGAIEDLAAGVCATPEHARAEVEQVRQEADIECAGRRGRDAGDRLERQVLRSRQVRRERDRVEVRVDLERDRLVLPVEGIRARVHTRGGMLAAFVVLAQRRHRDHRTAMPPDSTIA